MNIFLNTGRRQDAYERVWTRAIDNEVQSSEAEKLQKVKRIEDNMTKKFQKNSVVGGRTRTIEIEVIGVQLPRIKLTGECKKKVNIPRNFKHECDIGRLVGGRTRISDNMCKLIKLVKLPR